jgi:hypothetical protein
MLFGCQVTWFEWGKIGAWYHEEAMLLCGVRFELIMAVEYSF